MSLRLAKSPRCKVQTYVRHLPVGVTNLAGKDLSSLYLLLPFDIMLHHKII